MDQDPLPRGSSQVADRLAQVLDAAVAAENATYITERVIVVDVLRVGRAADGAGPALTGQERVEPFCPILYRRRRWYSRVLPQLSLRFSAPRTL